MKLTKKGEYALRALLALSHVYGSRVLTIREISEEEKISPKFLEQIMIVLKKAGLVQSSKGKFGGYTLSRAPQEITLGEIIRAVEGPLSPLGTVEEIEKRIQREENHAGLFITLLEVRNAISNILDQKTLADICEKSLEIQYSKKKSTMYFI